MAEKLMLLFVITFFFGLGVLGGFVWGYETRDRRKHG